MFILAKELEMPDKVLISSFMLAVSVQELASVMPVVDYKLTDRDALGQVQGPNYCVA